MFIPSPPAPRGFLSLRADDDPSAVPPAATTTIVWVGRRRPGPMIAGIVVGVTAWFLLTFLIFYCVTKRSCGGCVQDEDRQPDQRPIMGSGAVLPAEAGFNNASHVRHVDTTNAYEVPRRASMPPYKGSRMERWSEPWKRLSMSSTRGGAGGVAGSTSSGAGGDGSRRESKPPDYAPEPSPDCPRCAFEEHEMAERRASGNVNVNDQGRTERRGSDWFNSAPIRRGSGWISDTLARRNSGRRANTAPERRGSYWASETPERRRSGRVDELREEPPAGILVNSNTQGRQENGHVSVAHKGKERAIMPAHEMEQATSHGYEDAPVEQLDSEQRRLSVVEALNSVQPLDSEQANAFALRRDAEQQHEVELPDIPDFYAVEPDRANLPNGGDQPNDNEQPTDPRQLDVGTTAGVRSTP